MKWRFLLLSLYLVVGDGCTDNKDPQIPVCQPQLIDLLDSVFSTTVFIRASDLEGTTIPDGFFDHTMPGEYCEPLTIDMIEENPYEIYNLHYSYDFETDCSICCRDCVVFQGASNPFCEIENNITTTQYSLFETSFEFVSAQVEELEILPVCGISSGFGFGYDERDSLYYFGGHFQCNSFSVFLEWDSLNTEFRVIGGGGTLAYCGPAIGLLEDTFFDVFNSNPQDSGSIVKYSLQGNQLSIYSPDSTTSMLLRVKD